MRKFLFFGLLFFPFLWANGAIRVVTTTEDLQYLTKKIGGGHVKLACLSSGDQDLHMVEPRPSMVMKLKRADLLIKIGLDQDMWVDSLIAAAKNKKLFYGASGHADTSVGIPLLQVPKGRVDGSMGDIHVFGNPHYWLDPANAKIMAKNITEKLCQLLPGEAALFRENREKFDAELEVKLGEWKTKMAPFKDSKIVTYHNSWIYFAKRFGLELAGNIEPKPGIPPSPSHLAKLIENMKVEGVRVIMMETYYPEKGPRKVAKDAGAWVAVVPSSVGGLPGVESYFDLFDTITDKLVEALKR